MEPSTEKDDFIRPGESGFQNFPKHLPEDCVEYAIYLPQEGAPHDSRTRSLLKDVQDECKTISKSLLSGYIWQRESFSLSLKHGNGRWFLHGRTEFGDSISDEWLIVYILRELSKKFEDAWIRAWDADGEFLLIEAANALPRWLNPEVAENRVWINKGQLRIIPMEKSSKKGSGPQKKKISLEDALELISARSDELIHSPMIEEEAFYRIRNYPTQISESLHTARISIPRILAYILNRLPAHISPASEAFYLRDPIAMKPLNAALAAKLRFPPTDLVTVSVKFTRVGYAQLKAQEFEPPPAWEDTFALYTEKVSAESLEMGMKVSCGFEMLVSDPQNQDKKSVREILLLLEDIENEEETLPTDEEMSLWPQQEDDEKWMDVNFEDLEKELAGHGQGSEGNTSGKTEGFGDKAAQDNLRRIVEQFEKFLNDDTAGAEGAEFSDEMDYDNDEEETDSEVDEEDRDASFDEAEFANMMRQMMGLPEKGQPSGPVPATDRVEELDSDDDDDDEDSNEGDEIRKEMQRMEEELREAGALDLDPSGSQQAIDQQRGTGEAGDVDPQYILAKNLLDSLKSQAGQAGPAGNLMSSMGLKLPRDDEEDND